MARYFKGYDDDARRRILEQYRKGTGARNLPKLTDLVYGDADVDKQYSREVRWNEDGELEARFYKPRNTDDTPVREPSVVINPETGKEELQYTTLDFDSVSPDSARPAALTIVPTSSTNYKRPYTVAAGWERYPRQSGASSDNLGTLTVLFRDGTLWNYYDVDRSFWVKFRTSISKGEFIAKDLSSADLTRNYRNGPADVSRVSEQNRQLIYTIARASQYRFSTKRAYKYTNKRTGESRTVKPGAVPKSAQKKLGKNPNQK